MVPVYIVPHDFLSPLYVAGGLSFLFRGPHRCEGERSVQLLLHDGLPLLTQHTMTSLRNGATNDLTSVTVNKVDFRVSKRDQGFPHTVHNCELVLRWYTAELRGKAERERERRGVRESE